jgi:hypothetical protein
MLFLLITLLFIAASIVFLNLYIRKKTGIKEAIFYFKCEENAWVAETAWLDGATGRVCKIVTTSNWQDGVLSVLNNEETIYHTKQPCNDRMGLQRFHRIARNRFFIQVKWKAFVSTGTHGDVAY